MRISMCHGRVIASLVGCTALALALTSTTAQAHPRPLDRQTLGAADGWASYGTGTSGGATITQSSTVVFVLAR